MKKLLLIAFLLALWSMQANAFTYKKGDPYAGAGAGIQNIHGYNGLYATFFGGMNITMGPSDMIYLAGEAFVDTGSIPLSQKKRHRTTYGGGLSLLPGIVIAETNLAYLRVGVASFRHNKSNDWSTGGQLGLGLQTDINPCTAIRGEYVYTGRGVIHNFGRARYNFFNLAFLYKF